MIVLFVSLNGGDELGGAPWWTGRGDFSQPGQSRGFPTSGPGSGFDDEELSDVSSGGGDESGQGRKRTAQFTEYSITSSVVPRSEGTV